MLASISPLGERARGNRWPLTATAYAAGSVLGAALIGAALGGAGSVLPVTGSVRWAVAGVAVLAGAWDLLVGRPVPGVRRQVDENWLRRYRGWIYGLGFGFQLGAGFATVVATATVYAWMAAAVLTRSAIPGAALGAVFGFTRAAMLVTVRSVEEPDRLRARLRRLTAWAAPVRVGAGVASVAIGAGCALVAAGGR